MKTTSPAKAKLSKTVANRPQRAKRETADLKAADLTLSQRWNAYIAAQNALLEEVGAPSTTRKVMAFIASMLVAVGLGWLLGQVLSALFVGIVLLTGSSFLAWALWAFGLVIGAFYGGKAAARIGGAVLTKEADERAAQAYAITKHFVTAPLRWFTGKDDAPKSRRSLKAA